MRMSRYSRRGRARQNSEKNSFWLSFSDLMSALVLVIILVLFYILYQYFLMYDDYEERRDQMVILQASLEQSEADIASQQAALLAAQDDLTAAQNELDEKNSALNAAQEELTTAQGELNAAQEELTAAQEDLAVQQLLLQAAQDAANKTQEELDAQEAQLEQTLSQLDEQQAQLEAQQTQLAAQQSQIAAQQGQLEDQQRQIEDLVGVRTQIIADLSNALREADISATVDPTSGAIALASDVLFDTGESQLTAAGRERIDAFLPVYLDVLFSEEYRGYVSEIIIEGHTDSVGNYIDNLLLSQQRAYNVASYVLADNYPYITAGQRAHLRDVATANGRSFSDLIYNADGSENQSASRRVVFKFRLTDEQMVAQLQSILESGDNATASTPTASAATPAATPATPTATPAAPTATPTVAPATTPGTIQATAAPGATPAPAREGFGG